MGIFDSLAGGLGGGLLGAAIVEVGLDTRNLASGLVQARREVSAASAGMGKEAGFLKDNWTSFAAIAGVALIKFGADSVAAFEESERSIQNLQNAYQGNIQGLMDQSKALQTWSGYSDEAVQSAQATYARLKLNEGQIKALIPLTLDFARATGQDVPAAASSMSKALLGNTRALKAIGVSSQEFVVTGNRAKDAANLVQVLQDHIGGLARTESSNLDVKLQVLGNEFDDIKEQVGGAIVPALAEMASGLDIVVTHISEFIADVNAAQNAVAGFGESLRASFGGLLGTVLGPVVSGLQEIGKIQDDQKFLKALPQDFLKTVPAGTHSIDELRASYQRWLSSTHGVNTATGQLTQTQQKEISAAQKQKQALQSLRSTFNVVGDTMQNLANKAHLSAAKVENSFKQQLRTVKQYEGDWQTLEQRNTPKAVLDQLSALGLGGSRFVHELASSNSRDFNDQIGVMQKVDHQTASLTRQIQGIPSSATTHVSMDASAFNAQYNALMAKLAQLHRSGMTTSGGQSTGGAAGSSGGGGGRGRAP